MSVAFRRESDEAHIEPRFELPIPPGPNLVTARGERMIAARIATIEKDIATAPREDAQQALRRELRYWHTRRATAVRAPMPGTDTVAIGSRVHFRLNGRERTIDIVGHDEAEPSADRIAFTAPLAAAMLGAEPDERVDFNGVEAAIEILATRPIPGP